MTMRRMDTDEDDIQRMLTQVYRESEYKVGRRDPVIVPYIIQKNMLLDFKKDTAALFDDFAGKVLPPLQAETEKLQRRRDDLMALAQNMASDIVREAGEKFNRHMEEKANAEIDAAVLRHMDTLTKNLRDTEEKLAEMLDRQHDAFDETANRFLNVHSYLTAVLGGLFVAAWVWWNWLR
jgi:RNAse (barnase) inhibitor barstar